LVSVLISEALVASSQITWAIECSQDCHPSLHSIKDRRRDSGPRLCWTPELPFSPGHHRPLSRGSLASSRLSISHNSLTVPCCKADDSSFITLAMSHDVLIGELTASEISDIYNVPFDSDIYAVPIDMVHPTEPKVVTGPIRPKRKPHRKKKRQTSSSSETDRPSVTPTRQSSSGISTRKSLIRASAETLESSKRHSMPGTCSSKRPGPSRSSTECSTPREPIHMTLQEVRQYLQNLYSSSSDSSERKMEPQLPSTPAPRSRPSSEPAMPAPPLPPPPISESNISKRPKRNTFITNIKSKKPKDTDTRSIEDKGRKCNSFSASLKQTLCSLFRFRKMPSPEHQNKAVQTKVIEEPPSPSSGLPCINQNGCVHTTETARPPFSKRALPPLPASSPVLERDALHDEVPLLEEDNNTTMAAITEPVEELSMDFASSIEKVKDVSFFFPIIIIIIILKISKCGIFK
jgi:suppressor of cytokine signaling 7